MILTVFSRGPKPSSAPPPVPPASPAPPAASPAVLTRCHWRWIDLVSTDGHSLVVDFSAQLCALSEPAEATMFREVFGTGVVPPAAIISQFDAPLRNVAAGLAATHPAGQALDEAARSVWLQSLREAATKVAFTCGIEVKAPYAVEITSPSLQAVRTEQLQRAVAERRSADRLQQVKQAGELLSQWEQLRKTTPGASPGQLLGQVPAESRAEVLRTLLLADADRAVATPLWCVAGPNLVKIESTVATSVPLDGAAIGPLRSVSPITTSLLLGGQRGVATVPPSAVYLDPELRSEHGFSRAVQTTGAIWAVHRDGGVVRWLINNPEPQRTWRPAELGGVPRHIVAIGDDVLFAVENRVIQLTGEGDSRERFTTESPVAGLLRSNEQIIVVGLRGEVGVYDRVSFERQHGFDAGTGEVAGAALLPWVGSARLLVAGCNGPIVALGLDDDVVMRYTGAHAGYRAVAACSGMVAGLSPDRQRLVLWNASDGRRPIAEVHVAAATRHRVADLCFANAATV